MILLGLPGLYQNWSMAAADPTSKSQTHGDYNFFCSKSRFKWLVKNNLSQFPDGNTNIVVNLYVKRENIVWYLYNMFEKTYDIRIMVDNLVQDLIDKGHNFLLHNNFRLSMLKINHNDMNEVIDFFTKYFYCPEPADQEVFRVIGHTDDKYINVEYDMFSHPSKLKEVLSAVPDFDAEHFDNMYAMLLKTNKRYLNRKQDFLAKFDNDQNFDVLELAFIGCMLSTMQGKLVNWHNPKLREQILKIKSKEIKDFAQSLC